MWGYQILINFVVHLLCTVSFPVGFVAEVPAEQAEKYLQCNYGISTSQPERRQWYKTQNLIADSTYRKAHLPDGGDGGALLRC